MPISTAIPNKGQLLTWLGKEPSMALVVLFEDSAYKLTKDDFTFRQLNIDALNAIGINAIEITRQEARKKMSLNENLSYLLVGLKCLGILTVGLGIARGSLDYAKDYGSKRVVFEKYVLQHQANAFDIAKYYSELEALDCLKQFITSHFSTDLSDSDKVRAFSFFGVLRYLSLIDFIRDSTQFSVQLLGGHGYMEDELVEKYFRDARALVQLFDLQSIAREIAIKFNLEVKDPF